MKDTLQAHPGLLRLALSRFAGALLVLGAVFFLPAGTFNYWQAWVYMAVLLVPVAFVATYLIRNDPALLERRMHTHEPERQQTLIVRISWIWFALEYVLPGFDHRFGWSHVPTAVVIGADALVFLGYVFVGLVFRQNTYASRVVEVDQKQKVISTGLYGIVRHPMYLGVIIMYLVTPLALGSYWALIPAVFIIPTLVARIFNEEVVLLRDLEGYADYQQKVRFRLIPGVW